MYAKILLALDGSSYARRGGEIALSLSRSFGCKILAVHVYDAGLHRSRFQEMEPILPKRYQQGDILGNLRQGHEGLIQEGFEALSKGYMEQFLEEAKGIGVSVRQIHKEGRNYKEILHLAEENIADLIVLGAHGLGEVRGQILGSTARRVMRLASCDVLLARSNPPAGRVLAGIDGSEDSYAALSRAVVWARTFGESLLLVSVYDPRLHTQVFKTMAESLSPERQDEVGLPKQESLHEQIIDDGLRRLYQTFLDEGAEKSSAMGMTAETRLVQGKAFDSLIDATEREKAWLVVVGRFGHHREEMAQLGSNSEAVASLSNCHVLVTSAARVSAQPSDRIDISVEWDEDALVRLKKIPFFARNMARRAIEKQVRSGGKSRVTLEDFREAVMFSLPILSGSHGCAWT